MKPKQFNIVVMISGFGSNLQAIIDAIAKGLPANISAVISDNPQAHGLARAEKANITTQVINPQGFTDKKTFNAALYEKLHQLNPDLIVLAGYMRIIPAYIVDAFHGKMINIHPSLLPKYPGLNTHERVLAAGDKEHGVTVHFVDNVVDGGPIIAQEKLQVSPDDTTETLQQRIHKIEHVLYPKVIAWIAEGHVQLTTAGVKLDKTSQA